jgi:hypothetical protein
VRVRSGVSYRWVEYAYIVDFASIVLVCLGERNTGEAGEKSLRNRDERVASYLCHNLALTRGCTEAEEVLHGGKIGCLDVFLREPAPVQRLSRGREVLSGEYPFSSLCSAS